MHFVDFDESNKVQPLPDGSNIPFFIDPNGRCVTCVELTDIEIQLLKKTKRFYILTQSLDGNLPPQAVTSNSPIQTKPKTNKQRREAKRRILGGNQ